MKLSSLFSRDSAYSTKLVIDGEKMLISAVSPQLGESSSEIKLNESVNRKIEISINAQYLIDSLSVVSGDVKIGLTDAKSPLVVKEDKNKDYLYLLMPLRSE